MVTSSLIFLTITVIIAAIHEYLIRKYRKFILIKINDQNLFSTKESQMKIFSR